MEAVDKIRDFISPGYGSGYGNGNGSGSGSGFGYGNGNGSGSGSGSGSGFGSGNGNGFGDGYGSGYGNGNGSGSGSGFGSGYGNGFGDGYGNGDGDGDGYGIKSINGKEVHRIDYTPTVIYSVRGNLAKGAILQGDLTLLPCYVAKNEGDFAHGATIREAQEAIRDKLFEDMPKEERIAAFVAAHESSKTYPNKDFFDWHNRLTGSCLIGREAFARARGVDLDADMTPEEFIKLTENAYGGETIKKLKPYYFSKN